MPHAKFRADPLKTVTVSLHNEQRTERYFGFIYIRCLHRVVYRKMNDFYWTTLHVHFYLNDYGNLPKDLRTYDHHCKPFRFVTCAVSCLKS